MAGLWCPKNPPVLLRAGSVGSHVSVFPIWQKHPQGTCRLRPSFPWVCSHWAVIQAQMLAIELIRAGGQPPLLIRNNQQRVYPSHPSDPIIPFQNSKRRLLEPQGLLPQRRGKVGPRDVICSLEKSPLFDPFKKFLLKVEPPAPSDHQLPLRSLRPT